MNRIGDNARSVSVVLAILATMAGCAGVESKPRTATSAASSVATSVATSVETRVAATAAPVPMTETRSAFLSGYLPANSLPDSLALLPPPPAADSAGLALDEELAHKYVALRDTPRWTLAIADADYHFPYAAGAYSCALNAPITEQETPHLYTLLRRTFGDAAAATYAAKNHYKRGRPFMQNNKPICSPNDQALLEKDGSYPSGHSAFGWAWALILSEIAPDRVNAILARGRAFGESRNVCNVHWHSDVVEGRFVGTGVVALLHSSPAFRADVDAAKVELEAVRAKGLKPTRDCATETAQMNYSPATR